MFLTSADYFEFEGLKEEMYSRETVWCIHQSQEVLIVMDVFGRDVTIDPDFTAMTEAILALPQL